MLKKVDLSVQSTASLLIRAGRMTLDVLYPPRCALCHRSGSFLCATCEQELPRADGQRCRVCWLPWNGRFCPACDAHPIGIDSLRSPFRYEGGARTLVHEFKFRNFSALAESLARPMAGLVERTPALAADVIVPVPLSGGREHERGYNQAALIARELGKSLVLPIENALKRQRAGRPQSLTDDAATRRQNVEGAFEARRKTYLSGRRVLLIDDVATTGATLHACAMALRAAGAKRVAALTFAREDA